MELVERHVIKKEHLHYQEIEELCLVCKNFYNAANYLIRQSCIHLSKKKSHCSVVNEFVEDFIALLQGND